MKKLINISSFSLILATLIFVVAGVADAQKKSEKEVRDIIRTLNTKLDEFESSLTYRMQSNSAGQDDRAEASRNIRGVKDSVRQFQQNLDQKRETNDDIRQIVSAASNVDSYLKSNSQNQNVDRTWTDIRQQIDRLASIYGVTPNWNATAPTAARTDPGKYDPPKSDKGYGSEPATTSNTGLTGTYQLDTAKSENIDEVIAATNVPAEQKGELKDRLQPADQIAIDVRGNQVTLATSKSSPVNITADGRDKVEQSGSGKSVKLRATLSGQVLTLSNLGGDTDDTVTFTWTDDGKSLKVSRRFTTEYLSQTVFMETFYSRTDTVARLGIDKGTTAGDTTAEYKAPPPGDATPGYSDNEKNNRSPNNTPNNPPSNPNNASGEYSDNDQNTTPTNGAGRTNGGNPSNNRGSRNSGRNGSNYPNNRNNPNNGNYPPSNNPTYGRTPTTSTPRTGEFIVPSGTILGGSLESEINTKYSHNNDPFRLVVNSPSEFRGAVIEGYISGLDRSGRVVGDANVTLNFERITLASGKTYDFAGYLQSATDLGGKNLKVDAEGSIHGDNQTKTTAKRAGVGAGLGAIIGVIAGGGSGAAIGSVIGAGAGAGSVAVQGGDLILQKGSTMIVQSSSPHTATTASPVTDK